MQEEQPKTNNNHNNNIQVDTSIHYHKQQQPHQFCPYLHTVKRHLLDFDFEKVCSVSLSNVNVYGCLICGKYYQGKGKNTYAYTHALEESHYLFINLRNAKIYCLPDNYELSPQQTRKLEDVQKNLLPTFTPDSVAEINRDSEMIPVAYNLDGKQYIPGCVGLNNLKHTEFFNVTIHFLNCVKPLRQFLLLNTLKGPISDKLATLFKKIWNPQNFKGLVSPHQLIQSVADASQKKFKIGKNQDPVSFLLWLNQTIDSELKKQKFTQLIGVRSPASVCSLFRGKLKTSFFKPLKDSAGYESQSSKVDTVPFNILTIQIPSLNNKKETVTEFSLISLLERYTGQNPHDTPDGRKYYMISEYPEFLVLVYKRFTHNGFFKQKNTSIVRFGMTLALGAQKYTLLANICHEGPVDSGVFNIHVKRGGDKWFLLHDLHCSEIMANQVMISEAYVQLYRKI